MVWFLLRALNEKKNVLTTEFICLFIFNSESKIKPMLLTFSEIVTDREVS